MANGRKLMPAVHRIVDIDQAPPQDLEVGGAVSRAAGAVGGQQVIEIGHNLSPSRERAVRGKCFDTRDGVRQP